MDNYIITVRCASDHSENGTSITRYFYKSGNAAMIRSEYANTIYGKEGFPYVYNMAKTCFIDGKFYSYEYTDDGKVLDYQDPLANLDNWEILDTYASFREKSHYVGVIFENPLKVAIQARIKTVKFDGVDCYSIETKNKAGVEVVLYFEKETGLLRKLNDQEYYYSFNTVNDTIFELPEELETQNPLSDVYVVNFTR